MFNKETVVTVILNKGRQLERIVIVTIIDHVTLLVLVDLDMKNNVKNLIRTILMVIEYIKIYKNYTLNDHEPITTVI